MKISCETKTKDKNNEIVQIIIQNSNLFMYSIRTSVSLIKTLCAVILTDEQISVVKLKPKTKVTKFRTDSQIMEIILRLA